MKEYVIQSLVTASLLLLSHEASAEELFKTTPLTKPGEFTKGIEGPACDKAGNIYAVNRLPQAQRVACGCKD